MLELFVVALQMTSIKLETLRLQLQQNFTNHLKKKNKNLRATPSRRAATVERTVLFLLALADRDGNAEKGNLRHDRLRRAYEFMGGVRYGNYEDPSRCYVEECA